MFADVTVAENASALMDGRAAFISALREPIQGDDPILFAVARYAVFLHPDTVAASLGEPIFKVVRWRPGVGEERGKTRKIDPDLEVMVDDNTAAIEAFRLAAGLKNRGVDMQFNHIIQDSQNWRTYTALWNIVATPAFLAKPTDNHGLVRQALVRRALELYGEIKPLTDELEVLGKKGPPLEDDLFGSLKWQSVPAPVRGRDELLRALTTSTKTVANQSRLAFNWLAGELDVPKGASN
jgi:hypothetical protein